MVAIRLAGKSDFEFFFKLKSEDYNVFWAGAEDKPKREKLKLFFDSAVEAQGEAQNRKIYIVENEEGNPIGHIYIIPDGEECDISTAVLSEFCGRGYGKQTIKQGLDEGKRLGFKRMVCSIREDNIASMKAYMACGVHVTDEYKYVYIPKLGQEVKMYTVIYDFD